ncbi:MBL fold metallo-hydrolase [Marinomonas epiphytica]
MKIDVIGSGSAFSKVNNTSSILIEDDQENQWLIDCGPTVPRALWQRNKKINDIQVIFFTHIHPDHSSGLCALINHWKSFKRHAPLEIYCQQAQQACLKSLIELAIWPEQDICFDIHWHDIPEHFVWQNWTLSTASTQHEMSNLALRVECSGQSLFYSGDGRPTEESIALMDGVDLAFQECASFHSLPEDSSHGDLADCLRVFEQSDIGHLGLYHCYDNAIEPLQQALLSHPHVFVSHDGLIIELSSISSGLGEPHGK